MKLTIWAVYLEDDHPNGCLYLKRVALNVYENGGVVHWRNPAMHYARSSTLSHDTGRIVIAKIVLDDRAELWMRREEITDWKTFGGNDGTLEN